MWLALGAVIAAGVAVRISHLNELPIRTPDESYYIDAASRIANEGLAGTRALFAQYESDSARWSYPVPNRIGYMMAVAATMTAGSVHGFVPGLLVSLGFSVLSLVLLAWIGMRHFNPWVALGAVAFMAFSMGELAITPRAWVDAMLSCLSVLLLGITCEIGRAPRNTPLYLAFFMTGVLLLLTKQTGVVGYGVCALWLAWVIGMRARDWKRVGFLAAGVALSIALTIAIWGVLAGGVDVALSALGHSLRPSAKASAYVAEVSSGPWYQFFQILWIVGPLTAVLALVGGCLVIGRNRALPMTAEARAGAAALWMTLGFAGFASLVPGMQNLRYMTPADGSYCLLAGIGLWFLLSLARERLPAVVFRGALVVTIAIVALALARDVRRFTTVIHRPGIGDVTAKQILGGLTRPGRK